MLTDGQEDKRHQRQSDKCGFHKRGSKETEARKNKGVDLGELKIQSKEPEVVIWQDAMVNTAYKKKQIEQPRTHDLDCFWQCRGAHHACTHADVHTCVQMQAAVPMARKV